VKPRRISFIVTGDVEKKSLVPSLRRYFPATDIDGVPVTWLTLPKLKGATTHRLRAGADPGTPMRKLARAVVAEALRGADGTPADLVIAVDDVEVHNVDQIGVVCDHFRQAIGVEFGAFVAKWLVGEQAEARVRVRERCSFHLLSPMVESVFFGEHAALVRAGCAPGVEPRLASTDWEDFWCVDPDLLPHFDRENAAKAASTPWWREERHAKHYLEHLIGAHSGAFYEETSHGARALQVLVWPTVPKGPTDCLLLRALFNDLADFFGVHSPLGGGSASPETYVGPPGRRSTRLLRNM